ncbi:helix-turn-helix domain-containing protein [Brevundimonas subvibrioides]|uniref:Regulatory protein MerR n=1 Tax=Brevundimonas subvibrioides (strain ATCC 15264 / DSM 4735 / LMG 14903 / NBRC 16000 / CB 81) TaxID=633149 RepID=D9QIB4_BRESC|nr:helix-turn-helix domain-containing protein [Brevundimonas subvibrioides]ADK99416.1 regulatory protein MerR [Brevundimonas subvibrioides ATCC 15264]
MADGSTQFDPVAIGPATEARLLSLFASAALATAEATAAFLGIDVKSLRALTDAGLIRAVRRGGGGHRAYTEGDIRAYLTESAAPVREARPVVSHGGARVVPFTQRKGRPGR